MKKNMNSMDRIVRLFIGLALLFWTYFVFSWWLLMATLFVFFEVLFNWCIVYQILGINRCRCKK